MRITKNIPITIKNINDTVIDLKKITNQIKYNKRNQ